MTGINGHFFLVGGLDDYLTPGEVMQGMRRNADWLPHTFHLDKLHIQMSEQNLNPFHGGSESGGMRVTLFQYEFNGFTDEEGEEFLDYYQTREDGPIFLQELFNLPTKPLLGANGAPKWGEDPTGLPPTLNISPDEYDDWARRGTESRMLIREAEELDAQNRAQEARLRAEWAAARARPRGAAPAPAPRVRARGRGRRGREQLDDSIVITGFVECW